jgi:hypothetical protein
VSAGPLRFISTAGSQAISVDGAPNIDARRLTAVVASAAERNSL